MDLIQLAKLYPEIQVSIKLSDLLEANQILIEETKRQLEDTLQEARTETYISPAKACEMLEVSKATLWRWNKMGYLNVYHIGGKSRYKMSDIKNLLGEKLAI